MRVRKNSSPSQHLRYHGNVTVAKHVLCTVQYINIKNVSSIEIKIISAQKQFS